MILPASSTLFGRRGAICPIYASLSVMMQRSRGRDWQWSRASSQFWHRVWPCSASTPRMRCDRRGALPHSGGCEGIWRGRFVFRSELVAFLSRGGRITTMADRYQSRPYPTDDDYHRGDESYSPSVENDP